MKSRKTKFLVIGAGPAGYTAAIYAARSNLEPVLVRGPQPGGQLTITTEIENYPGFAEPVQGPWLMEQMAEQAKRVGTTMIEDEIVEVDFSSRPLRCVGASGDEYLADVVVIATGAQAKWLGREDEEHFKGFGVSGCATCDGFFYRGKPVMIIGGGNAAMEEALYLSQLASHVTMVHRRDEFRGEKIMRQRVAHNDKITVLWDSVLDEIKGEETPARGVIGVVVRNVKTDEKKDVQVDGIFIAIGHSPATSAFKGKIGLDDEGYIVTKPETTETSVAGVFAAGDVCDKKYRQAVTAAGMGCMAALEAEKYLNSLEE
ncbi:MAG TPA: thioredoxin-disulfide reductase [Rhodospirillaceae bacterium]|nr:thioredoxin-disulfide reductase [Rhodospirillaceae bacterium]